MVKLLSLFFTLSMSYQVFGEAVTIQSVTGASAQVGIGTTNSTTIDVYGGLAGTCTGGSPCNSCANVTDATAMTACNDQRILRAGTLSFTLKTAGTVNAKVIDEASTVDIGSNTGSSTTSATVTWDDLCIKAAIPDCDAVDGGTITQDKIQTVRVWQDNNSNNTVDSDEAVNVRVHFVPAVNDTADLACLEGVCPFKTFPGDEKIYLDDMQLPGSLANGSKVSAVRVMFSSTNFNSVTPAAAEKVDLSVTDDEIETTIVDGLENGTVYHFRLAVVDSAKNVIDIHDDTFIAGGGAGCLTANGAAASDPATCLYAGKPDQVLGLLTKDMNCFIATAAYGSSFEPKLKVFRKFRYFLLHKEWGRAFVRWYYDVGPRGAMFIHDKPWAKTIVQWTLWPAYGFALLTLHWGFTAAVAIFTLIPLLLLGLISVHRRKSARAQA